MNPIFTKRLTVFLCALSFLFQQVNAQAPTITDNTGLPMGNASNTGVAYGNSVYITTMSAGKIYISNDGDNWSKVTDAGIPGSATFNRIVFANGVFVIAGGNGLILTSANGLNWTTRTSGTTNSLNDVQYLQSNFYIVGNNRTLLKSADGITWAAVTLGSGVSTDMMMSITYGAGVFAIGSRNSGQSGVYIYRSATGASGSWTYANVSTNSVNRLQYLKNKFFVFCSSTDVYTSTDASSWTNSTTSLPLTLPNATVQNIGSPNQVFQGFYDGTKIYLFGSSGYYSGSGSGYGSIFSSTDGVNFTLQSKTAYIVSQNSAYLNGKYFQVGNEGIVSSTDGIHYKYPGGSYYGLASSGTSYVGVGLVSSAGVIFTSSDYTTWSEKTPSSAQTELYSVVYNGSKYVATGNQTVVESTDNGNTWTQTATPAYTFTGMDYGQSKYVAAGYTTAYASVIAYSANSTSWTVASSADNYYFRVRQVNNKFFALGYANATSLGVVMYSPDGVSWTDITPSLPYSVYYFSDVAYDGSKYYFTGMTWADPVNYIYGQFFSISTATPTNSGSFANTGSIVSPPAANLGGAWGEGSITYSNGRFVGSVSDANNNDAYIIYSANGVNWTAVSTGETSSVYGIMAEGTKFRMLGTGDAKLTATFNTLLPVKLVDFTASPVNGQSLLQWKTGSESNSDHFTVQHSTDGLNWNAIGSVKAAGQSQVLTNYQFTHTSPDKGANYYRLLQVDKDGKQDISIVKQVYFGKSGNAQLYPNPAHASVQLILPGTGYATVSLINAVGQQVYQQSGSGSSMQLSLEHLSNGIYQVVVSQGAEKYTQTLSHQ